MIHHAYGPDHYAHTEALSCPTVFASLCAMPELPEGDDGKCDWCRTSDKEREAPSA